MARAPKRYLNKPPQKGAGKVKKSAAAKKPARKPTNKAAAPPRRALGNISNVESDNESGDDSLPKKRTARGRRAAVSYEEKSESESEAASGEDESNSGGEMEPEKKATAKKGVTKKPTERKKRGAPKKNSTRAPTRVSYEEESESESEAANGEDESNSGGEMEPEKKATAKKGVTKKPTERKKRGAPKKNVTRASKRGGEKSSGDVVLEELATDGSPEVIPDFTQKFAHENPKKKKTKTKAASEGDFGNVEGYERRASSKLEDEVRADVSDDWRCMAVIDW